MRLHTNHNRRVRIKSNAVYEILDRLHMSQSELARQAGLSTGYVSQVISGKRAPSPHVRRKIQRALGVDDFDELFELEVMHDT